MTALPSTAFRNIYFVDCNIGIARVDGQQLVVPIRNAIPLFNHPPLVSSKGFYGRMVFSGVTKSVRLVAEFIGEPKTSDDFRPQYKIVDMDAGPVSDDLDTFAFEGVSDDPRAWVDWTVTARSVHFLEGD